MSLAVDLPPLELPPPALSRLSVQDAAGIRRPLDRVFLENDAVFFTCGCEPCKKVGRNLAQASAQLALVSFLPKAELDRFAIEVGWKGPAFTDRGSAAMIALNVTDCPKVAAIREGRPSAVTVEELTKNPEERH